MRVEQKTHFYVAPLSRRLWLLKCSPYQGSSAGVKWCGRQAGGGVPWGFPPQMSFPKAQLKTEGMPSTLMDVGKDKRTDRVTFQRGVNCWP